MAWKGAPACCAAWVARSAWRSARRASARKALPAGVGAVAAAPPLEQTHPEAALELGDLRAHRGLGGMGGLGGGAEGAPLRERHGVGRLPQRQ